MKGSRGAERVIGVLLAVTALVVIINTFRMTRTNDIVQSAKTGTFSSTVDAVGYIVRDETVMAENASGVLESTVQEGERVTAYESVGALITGDADTGLMQELTQINAQIEALSQSVSSSGASSVDDSQIDGTLSQSLENLKYAAAKGNTANAVNIAEDIRILAERKAGLTSSSDTEAQIEALEARKSSISASLNGVREEIYAPRAGMYSKNVDGLESSLTPEVIENVTAKDVDGYDELIESAAPQGLCKIVNNYKWYLVFAVEAEQIADISSGKSYSVKFKEASDKELSGTVTYISEEDEDGRCAVVMQFTGHLDNLASIRKTDIVLYKARFSGIYIPVNALVVKDGVTGVYVQSEQSRDFKSIEILYRTDDFVLADPDADGIGDYDNIELYDSIILNPGDETLG